MTAISPALSTDLRAPRSGASHFVADALVFARRNIEHIRQIPEKLLDVTLQPLMFVRLFTYVFGGAISISGGTYREYIIGGILVQSLAFGMTGPATSIATDLQEGVIDRFRSLPAARSAYLAGHYLAELAGMLLSIVVLLGTGLLIGWRAHTDALHVGTALVLLLCFASAMIWFGTWIGIMVRTPDAVMGVAFVVVFPVTFLSSAFVPIETLPTVLQWVASYNPVSAVVAATRELFGNPVTPVVQHAWPLEQPVLASFLYCAVLGSVAVPGALRRYRARTAA
ncbi:MAG: ABC transporter permease [Actinobacteria bacterium]|nr:ABC transporter permease [Actinomycetota bacterium]